MRRRLADALVALAAGALGALVVVMVTGLWPARSADATGLLAAEPSIARPSPTPSPTGSPSTAPTPAATRASRTAADHSVAPKGTARFVSLTAHQRQRVRPGRWTELRFDGEPSDHAKWHRAGASTIVPDVTAVAQVCMKVTWVDDPRPSQYYLQIARDPHGRRDVTGAENYPNSPGRDYRAGCWVMTIRKGQPLAVRVKHDGPAATSVHFAEFKVWVP